MSAEALKPFEFEQLSAYVDGELPAGEAERVAARIAEEPAWAAAAVDLNKLDGLLDAWKTPPLRRDMTASVLARATRPAGLPGWVRVLAPLAAAAAIVLSVWSYHTFFGGADKPTPIAENHDPAPATELPVELAKALGGLPKDDRFAVENLDLLEDYEVISDFATLEALDKLEQGAGGGDS